MVPPVAGDAVSRAAAALSVTGARYVRRGVEAKATPVAQPMGIDQAITTAVTGLLLLTAVVAWQARRARSLAIGFSAVLLAPMISRRRLRHRLGGDTGDGLGAMQPLAARGFARVAGIAALRTDI